MVIGAGMAGVTSARALVRAGARVTVLEAGQRIGGRIRTIRDFAGTPVEAGAEFIHGVRAATWADVRACGARVQPVPYRYSWFDIAGHTRWLPLHLAHPGVWRSFDILFALGRTRQDVSAAEFLSRKGYRGRALELAELALTAHLPGGTAEIGVRGLVADGVLRLEEGLNHRVLDGYDVLPRHIAAGLDVRFGWPVAHVRYTRDQVTVTAADGRTFTARAGVIAVPHGVLAGGGVTFDPPLPAAKQDAISCIRTGPVAKVMVRFDERFWPRRMAQLVCGSGPLTLYWPPSFGVDGPAVLVGYATGPRAAALSAAGPDRAPEIVGDDLDRLFPRVRPSRLVRDVRLVDWLTDPLAMGGYTFLPPGALDARARLAAADTGALFWAGSSTVSSPIADTVEAAYRSGLRAAREASDRGE